MILLWCPPPHLAIFLELSSCSCIEKNTQPNISICAAQKKEHFTSLRWVNAWTIPLKMLSLSKCYTEALQEMYSMQFKLWSYATFLKHPTSQIWRGQNPALTLKSSQVSIIRGVHYLLHLLLKGIFNWKEKGRGGNESGIFHFFSSSLHTLTFQSVFPSASWAWDHFDGEMWVDVSVFALTEPAWCHGGFGIRLNAGEGWKRWRERGRER